MIKFKLNKYLKTKNKLKEKRPITFCISNGRRCGKYQGL